jgi:hypothetical protein
MHANGPDFLQFQRRFLTAEFALVPGLTARLDASI